MRNEISNHTIVKRPTINQYVYIIDYVHKKIIRTIIMNISIPLVNLEIDSEKEEERIKITRYLKDVFITYDDALKHLEKEKNENPIKSLQDLVDNMYKEEVPICEKYRKWYKNMVKKDNETGFGFKYKENN